MTKDELKKEAEECMHNALFWLKLPISKENVEQGGSYILKLLEPREKRIAELEKENAELKDDNKVMADNYSKMEQKFYNNLTKAKEILKRCYDNYIYLQPLRGDIEQFLNSEVEK